MAKAKVVETNEDKTSKSKRMSEFMKKMEKDFGEGSIMGANDKPKIHEIIPTGSIGLDKALGIGGLPRGRVVEIFGPESSGKTTVAMHVMAEAQKKDKDATCAIVDAEHAFSTVYAEGMGIDLDRLYISQPDYGEQALEMTRKLVESGEFDVVVVDSVAALIPKSELEGVVGDSKMGLQARMMSQVLRMLTAAVNKSNCVLIFINQLREKIGGYGGGEVTTGGNALKFYASIRMDVRRNYSKDKEKGGAILEDGELIGNLTKVKVIKNKVAPPFRQCEFNIMYGTGIDTFGEIVKASVESGIITKAGSWYSYEDKKIGQGFETVKQFLSDNVDIYDIIKKKVEDSYVAKEFAPTEDDLNNSE